MHPLPRFALHDFKRTAAVRCLGGSSLARLVPSSQTDYMLLLLRHRRAISWGVAAHQARAPVAGVPLFSPMLPPRAMLHSIMLLMEMIFTTIVAHKRGYELSWLTRRVHSRGGLGVLLVRSNRMAGHLGLRRSGM